MVSNSWCFFFLQWEGRVRKFSTRGGAGSKSKRKCVALKLTEVVFKTAQKYAQLHPKDDKKGKKSKEQKPKEEKPKQEKKEKPKDDEEEEAPKPQPKKDPYADLPPRFVFVFEYLK